MSLRGFIGAACVWLSLAFLAAPAWAHEPTLAVLQLKELGDGAFLAHWQIRPGDQTDLLHPIFPQQCTWEPPRLTCQSPGLAGRIGFEGLGTETSAVLVRVLNLDGSRQSYTLTAVTPTARLFGGARSTLQDWADLVFTYLRAGVDHILHGPDHLLFVLGLVGIIGWRRDLLLALTAFSVAHSVTLAAAALQVVTPPIHAVEATLALSVLFLAPEMVRVARGQASFLQRRPWLIAGGFGLLHGFGFATALTEAGLPAGERPYALLGFNVGVELGQIAFLAFLWLLVRAARQLGPWRAPSFSGGTSWMGLAPAYGVGSFGAAWVIGRTVPVLGAVLGLAP